MKKSKWPKMNMVYFELGMTQIREKRKLTYKAYCCKIITANIQPTNTLQGHTPKLQ